MLEVITAIWNDVWNGLLNMEGGFVIAFLGLGAVLLAIIVGAVNLIKSYMP
ncbi:MAG: hypothetical protein BWX62_00366 [Bacteroidetes bacterium ADurb.Bin037]|nr:MAG: hypothetical protein BWX62_00366 [Bacteroidetes bacterium ADurb.Bin037]HPW78590.1 hypothetical protein [Bacteroidales bacterium]HQB56068.1 hypothetical protein [Bacteroidales bacterium]